MHPSLDQIFFQYLRYDYHIDAITTIPEPSSSGVVGIALLVGMEMPEGVDHIETTGIISIGAIGDGTQTLLRQRHIRFSVVRKSREELCLEVSPVDAVLIWRCPELRMAIQCSSSDIN